MQNCTNGVNGDCAAALPPNERWRCMFANYSYAYSVTSMFPLQSALDLWQMGNILRIPLPCRESRNFKTNCSQGDVAELQRYEADF
eukprot:gene6999-5363_t